MRSLGVAFGLALVITVSLPQPVNAATIERVYEMGNEPFGVTIDPGDGRIYVANSDQGANRPGFLSVVDPAVQCSPFPPRCVTTIPLQSPPAMSALDRGLGRLFVTTAIGTLAIVDTASQTVVDEIPNAGKIGVALDEATHHVYAAAVSSLSKIDGATGDVLHTVPAGPGDSWWAVALDTVVHRVYVTNLDVSAPSLVVLSSDDLSFIDEIPLPESPRLALAVDVARQRVYVGGYTGPGRLYVIDATSLEIASTLDLGAGSSVPFSATLVTADDELYLSQISFFGPNSIVILNLATLQVTQRISLPWQPGATALHANGRLYVASISADLLAVVIRNSAPVMNGVSLSSSAPGTNDTLVATASATDVDGDVLTYTFSWRVDGVLRQTTSGPNASSSYDLSVAGNGDHGQTVVVEVTVSDGALESAGAAASAVVANTAPTVTVALSDTTPQSRDTLTATATTSDIDGDQLALTYTWAVNGVVRQTGASDTFDLSQRGNGDNGDAVTVTAMATDGSASASATANATVTPGRRN